MAFTLPTAIMGVIYLSWKIRFQVRPFHFSLPFISSFAGKSGVKVVQLQWWFLPSPELDRSTLSPSPGQGETSTCLLELGMWVCVWGDFAT